MNYEQILATIKTRNVKKIEQAFQLQIIDLSARELSEILREARNAFKEFWEYI
ncbi:hypothetical protein [Heyndrickxia acidicola]|uniref:Uncharacterized protein n=1 Tax=Heyndrickxia acidicola TaxID=209389 RepID=A0ABU6MME0_9BACI|nr:hypothetical protein [Heyndrickxia acidicola]MED1205567.1 hypothetical protein [Heyndrickxia acidicola]